MRKNRFHLPVLGIYDVCSVVIIAVVVIAVVVIAVVVIAKVVVDEVANRMRFIVSRRIERGER